MFSGNIEIAIPDMLYKMFDGMSFWIDMADVFLLLYGFRVLERRDLLKRSALMCCVGIVFFLGYLNVSSVFSLLFQLVMVLVLTNGTIVSKLIWYMVTQIVICTIDFTVRNIIIRGIAVLIFVLLIRRKNIHTYFVEKSTFGVSVVVLISICANFFMLLMFGLYLGDGQLENTKFAVLILILFAEILQIIFILALVILMQSKKAVEETLKQQKDFFEELDQKNQDIRKFKHDFFAYVAAMKGMVQKNESDKLAKYVMELDKNTEPLYYINTGNSLASTFVNRAYEQAKREDISFEFIGGFPKEMRQVTDMELSSLLYNVLQNALEATQKTTGKRNIFMEVSTDEEYVYINVTNPTIGINEKGVRLLTTKIDGKNHGIGMRQMEAIAKNTGGILQWKCQGGEFHVFISIGR